MGLLNLLEESYLKGNYKENYSNQVCSEQWRWQCSCCRINVRTGWNEKSVICIKAVVMKGRQESIENGSVHGGSNGWQPMAGYHRKTEDEVYMMKSTGPRTEPWRYRRKRDYYCRNFGKSTTVITARRELWRVLFLAPSVSGFLFVCKISREPLNGFDPNSQRKLVCSHAGTSLKVKVKGQRSRSPGTKNGIFRPFGGFRAVYVW